MAESLASYVKATTEQDLAFVTDCAEQATAMVDQFITDNGRDGVTLPPVIKARAVLEVGAELYFRRGARLGIAGLEGAEATPMRISRDPMRAAYDLLTPYTKPALA